MLEPYPHKQLDKNGLINEQYLLKMARRNQVMPWMGTGAIYGNACVVRAVKSVIKDKLSSVTRRLVFFTPQSTNRFKLLSHYMPGSSGRTLQNIFSTLDKTLQLQAGSPSEIALPLAYWISGKKPESGAPMNPAHDGCGLIWYSPLVPMHVDKVRIYTNMVREVCVAYRFEPLITLTSLSDRCFDSTVPLLFNRASKEALERAEGCYEALIVAGREIGCMPYRSKVDSMQSFIKPEAPYWQLVTTLKRELDPLGLISPGRYSAVENNR